VLGLANLFLTNQVNVLFWLSLALVFFLIALFAFVAKTMHIKISKLRKL